jgi:hypothetical protein
MNLYINVGWESWNQEGSGTTQLKKIGETSYEQVWNIKHDKFEKHLLQNYIAFSIAKRYTGLYVEDV